MNPDPLGLPDAVMIRPSVVAVLDGVKGDVILVAPAWADSGLSARAAYAQAAERVMDAQRALERPAAVDSRALSDPSDIVPPVSNFTHQGYLDAVEKAKEYIEHLMLLDLGRNDTAKVTKVGTMRPTEQFTVDACGDRFRGTQGARDGDYRRAGAGKARRLRRRLWVFQRQWRHGHVYIGAIAT